MAASPVESGEGFRTNPKTTDKRLIKWSERALGALTSSFEVDGQDNLDGLRRKLALHPDHKYMIVGSHLSNLDVPAAVKTLGDFLEINVVNESMHYAMPPQKALMGLSGKENFVPVSYRQGASRRVGVFSPSDFEPMTQRINEGKTPWMAIHPFTDQGKMLDARIGPIYLALKNGAEIIPAALELRGASVSMEGGGEILKALVGKTDAKYHVGAPVKLESDIDLEAIDVVYRKRAAGEKVTPEERQAFSQAHKELLALADNLAAQIALMLPEEQRGPYAQSVG